MVLLLGPPCQEDPLAVGPSLERVPRTYRVSRRAAAEQEAEAVLSSRCPLPSAQAESFLPVQSLQVQEVAVDVQVHVDLAAKTLMVYSKLVVVCSAAVVVVQH